MAGEPRKGIPLDDLPPGKMRDQAEAKARAEGIDIKAEPSPEPKPAKTAAPAKSPKAPKTSSPAAKRRRPPASVRRASRQVTAPARAGAGSLMAVIGTGIALSVAYLALNQAPAVAGLLDGVNKAVRWARDPIPIPYRP